MYRINKEESFFFRLIKEWSESNKPNFVNTSPYVMHLICQKDPSFIVNAKGRAITLELLETTLNLVDDKEKFIMDILNDEYHNKEGISSNPIAMKYFCSVCGQAFIYAKEQACTFENFQIAINEKNSRYQLDINKVNEALSRGAFPGYGDFTSKYDLEKFCELDGRFLNLCRDVSFITEKALMLSLSHKDDNLPNIDIIMNRIKRKRNPKLNRLLVQTNGLCLLYMNEEEITKELVDIAINNSDESKRLTYDRIPKRYVKDYHNERSYIILEELIKQDSRWLNYLKVSSLTQEKTIELLNNCNPLPERFLRNVFFEFGNNEQVLEKLVSIDGIYALSTGQDFTLISRLIDKAMLHTDPNKKLTYDRYGLGFNFNCKVLKKLIKNDPRWIQKVSKDTIDEETLIEVINHPNYKYIPSNELIMKFSQNEKVVEAIIKQNELGKYTTEDIKEMLSSNMSEEFVNTKLFSELMKKQCNLKGLDYDFFINFVKKVSGINEDIFSSINLELFQSKYHCLYSKDGYEKLFAMSGYSEIQDKIVYIGNYSNQTDKTIGEKNVLLLSKMLECAYTNNNGEKIEEWVTCFNQIVSVFEKNISLYTMIAKNQDELDEVMLKNLTMYALGKHEFEIKSIDDLRKYREIRKAYIEKRLQSTDLINVKGALLEKTFGISYQTALDLYKPYCEGVLRGEKIFDPNLVIFFKQLNIIMKQTNIKRLKEVATRINITPNLDEKDYIHIGTMIKKRLLKEYNSSLYYPSGKPSDDINGVKLYKAAGEDGARQFNLSIHVLGAYSSFNPDTEGFNFKENWTRPLINNHGICTSYIGNNHLGAASIESCVLGFTNYENGSLLLSGPSDIYSTNATFDISGDELGKCTFLLPNDMKDSTRKNHNEMVFERRVEDQKRMPSYVVYFCDDYEKAKRRYERYKKRRHNKEKDYDFELNELNPAYEAEILAYSIKAAQDFNIPIVVVERKKIIQKEKERINKSLRKFSTDTKLSHTEIKQYLHDTLIDITNNNIGNDTLSNRIKKKDAIDKWLIKKTIFTIKRKIRRYINSDPLISLMIIDELEDVLTHEKNGRGKLLYSPYSLSQDIKKIRDHIIKKCDNPRHIISFFDKDIDDNSYLVEYNSKMQDKVTLEQYSINDLKNLISKDTKSKVFLTINEIDNDNLYPKDDIQTRRHIENTLLLAGVIASQIELPDYDLDLLLLATLYHDIGKRGISNHAKSSSLVAYELLKDKYEDKEIKIIQAVIESHEDSEKDLSEICNNLGLDPLDKTLMMRIEKISYCLKDANNLDKTRYLSNSEEYFNSSTLYFDVSKKLIKPVMQMNEMYAYQDVMKLIDTNPELYSNITETLRTKKNPKEIICIYQNKKDVTSIKESGLSYGK